MEKNETGAVALAKLHFGRDDAETDLGELGLLRAGFVETTAFADALSGRKQLLIGRKGSGKSALRVMLAQSAHPWSSVITPDQVATDQFRRFELHGVMPSVAKQFVWQYVLCVQLAIIVVGRAQETTKKIPASVARVRDFLKANGELGNEPPRHGRFFDAIQRLPASLSVQAFGVQVAAKTGEGGAPEVPDPEGLRVDQQLKAIEHGLAAALKDIGFPEGHEPLLLIDDLDDIWLNDEASDDLIVGLLRAAKCVPERFPGVRCVVCLRSDMYDALKFPGGDKLRGDEIRLGWTPRALADLLVKRAGVSLGMPVSESDLFGSWFPDRIAGASAADYLVARTLWRPRDLIQFANRCRDIAADKGHLTITEDDVLEAEMQYSSWKLNDLAAEYGLNLPFLGELFALFQELPYKMTLADMAQRFSPFADELHARYPRYTRLLTPEGVTDALHTVGFLGVVKSDFVEYSYQSGIKLNGLETEFHVHPCFREALRTPADAALPTSASMLSPSPAVALERNQSNSASAVDIFGAVSKEQGFKISNIGNINVYQGGSLAFRGGPEDELYDLIENTLDRILDLLCGQSIDPFGIIWTAPVLRLINDTRIARTIDGVEPALTYARTVAAALADIVREVMEAEAAEEKTFDERADRRGVRSRWESSGIAPRIARMIIELIERTRGGRRGYGRPSEIS